MPDRQPLEKVYPFEGGMTTDGDATARRWEDLINLLPPPGGGAGLKPREGVDFVIELTSAESSGCEVFLVTLDDVTRTKLVVCRNASSDDNISIFEYTEQYGKKPQDAFSGGRDPDDPGGFGEGDGYGSDTAPDPPSVTPVSLEFSAATYSGSPGSNVTITVNKDGASTSTGACSYDSSDVTAVAGTDYTAVSSTLSLGSGTTSTTFDVTLAAGTQLTDKTFRLNLFNPTSGYLSSPDRAVVTINRNADYAPVMGYGGAGGMTFHATFYNSATNAVTQEVLTTSVTTDSSARLLRISSAVVGVLSTSFDTLDLYRIADISSGSGANAAYASVALGSGTKKVYPYPGDYLYVTAGSNLLKITIATGVIVSTTAMTGLTSYNAITTGSADWSAYGQVSSDGYPLVSYSQSGASPNHRLAKVNPLTAAAFAVSGVQSINLSNCYPLPSGAVGINNSDDFYSFNANLSTLSNVVLNTDVSGSIDGIPVNAAGRICTTVADGAGDIVVYDAVVGTLIGSSGSAMGNLNSGGACVSATEFIHPYSANPTYQIKRISNDGATVGSAINYSNVGGMSGVPVPDAFAYTLQNIVTALG